MRGGISGCWGSGGEVEGYYLEYLIAGQVAGEVVGDGVEDLGGVDALVAVGVVPVGELAERDVGHGYGDGDRGGRS